MKEKVADAGCRCRGFVGMLLSHFQVEKLLSFPWCGSDTDAGASSQGPAVLPTGLSWYGRVKAARHGNFLLVVLYLELMGLVFQSY